MDRSECFSPFYDVYEPTDDELLFELSKYIEEVPTPLLPPITQVTLPVKKEERPPSPKKKEAEPVVCQDFRLLRRPSNCTTSTTVTTTEEQRIQEKILDIYYQMKSQNETVFR